MIRCSHNDIVDTAACVSSIAITPVQGFRLQSCSKHRSLSDIVPITSPSLQTKIPHAELIMDKRYGVAQVCIAVRQCFREHSQASASSFSKPRYMELRWLDHQTCTIESCFGIAVSQCLLGTFGPRLGRKIEEGLGDL